MEMNNIVDTELTASSEAMAISYWQMASLEKEAEKLSLLATAAEKIDTALEDFDYANKAYGRRAAILGVKASLEHGTDPEEMKASLEASVKETATRVWDAILRLFDRIAATAEGLIDRYRRATIGIHQRARNAQYAIRNMGGSLPESKAAAGINKMTKGLLKSRLVKLSRSEGNEMVFDMKCIGTLIDTGKLLERYMADDAADAKGFVDAIKKDSVDALEAWAKPVEKSLWGLKTEKSGAIPGSEMIGCRELYVTKAGIVGVRASVEKPTFARQELFERGVKLFARTDILVKLTEAVIDGCKKVREYNNSAKERISVTLETKAQLQKAIRSDNGDMSEKRKIISAWSKVAYRRSELTSLVYIRALETGQQVATAFI